MFGFCRIFSGLDSGFFCRWMLMRLFVCGFDTFSDVGVSGCRLSRFCSGSFRSVKRSGSFRSVAVPICGWGGLVFSKQIISKNVEAIGYRKFREFMFEIEQFDFERNRAQRPPSGAGRDSRNSVDVAFSVIACCLFSS